MNIIVYFRFGFDQHVSKKVHFILIIVNEIKRIVWGWIYWSRNRSCRL